MGVLSLFSLAVLATPIAKAVDEAPTGGASGEAKEETKGCTITAKVCRNFPEYERTQFRDALGEEHLETSWNEAACLKRAEDFHHWCGNGAAEGAQIAATHGPKRLSQLYHQGACDAGWSQWDAFCYKYFWEMRTWPEAEQICRDQNAHLCSIHSQAENRFVAVLSRGLKAWLGYTDIDQDTHYQWTDNSQDDFTNFAKNCTGREHEPDCKPEEVQQQWYTSKGHEKSPYVCKMNAKIPLTLLKNTSAHTLTEVSWPDLLPALIGSAHASSSSTGTAGLTLDTLPSLKVQELIKISGDGTAKSKESIRKAVPKTHLVMPKGSIL